MKKGGDASMRTAERTTPPKKDPCSEDSLSKSPGSDHAKLAQDGNEKVDSSLCILKDLGNNKHPGQSATELSISRILHAIIKSDNLRKCVKEINELEGMCKNGLSKIVFHTMNRHAMQGQHIHLLSQLYKRLKSQLLSQSGLVDDMYQHLQLSNIDIMTRSDQSANLNKIRFLGALCRDRVLASDDYGTRVFTSLLQPLKDIIFLLSDPEFNVNSGFVEDAVSELSQCLVCYFKEFPSTVSLLDDWLNKLSVLSESPFLLPTSRSLVKDILGCKHEDVPKRELKLDALPRILCKRTVIILLGAPGIGKSTLGDTMQNDGRACMFLDTGHTLLKRGDIKQSERLTTKSRKQQLSSSALQLLYTSLRTYFQSDGSLPMVITFVKETKDVYEFLKAIKTVSNEFHIACSIQAWHLRGREMSWKISLGKAKNDAKRDAKKMQKWMHFSGPIQEVFASKGLLYDLSWKEAFRTWNEDGHWVNERLVPSFTWSWLSLEQDLDMREQVINDMKAMLGVNDLSPAIPGSFVTNAAHVEWLAFPGRYRISNKADGVRYFLFIADNMQLWFVNRIGTVYSTNGKYSVKKESTVLDHFSNLTIQDQSCSCEIACNTVLDGELVLHCSDEGIKTWTFLAFDILCNNSIRTWHLPYSVRSDLLTHNVPHMELTSFLSLRVKESVPFSVAAVRSLLRSQAEKIVGYPTDGLVFTPELSYTFGTDHLLYKWQQPNDIKADLDYASIAAQAVKARSSRAGQYYQGRRQQPHFSNTNPNAGDSEELLSSGIKRRRSESDDSSDSEEENSLLNAYYTCDSSFCPEDISPGHIYECVWSVADQVWTPVKPLKIRVDKCSSNSKESLAQMQEMMSKTSSILDLCSVLNSTRLMDVSNTIPLRSSIHPARSIEFKSLLQGISLLIEKGTVECSVDAETGLHVYSYIISSSKKQGSTIADHSGEDICRGLILHPSSESVVATSFVRFYKPSDEEISDRKDQIVRASMKYDGSLIIAFLWNGSLYTSTRRRMNSEQALWAKDYLRGSHEVFLEMKPGWTYLFELIGGDNRHIVDYNSYQCLILLTAFTDSGEELSDIDRCTVATRMNLQSPPALHGRLEDFIAMTRSEKRSSIGEGWVVEDLADDKRFKLINSAWSRASAAMKLLVHPAVVWDAMRMGRLKTLIHHRDLPKHARIELEAMADCITAKFESVYFLHVHERVAIDHSTVPFLPSLEREPLMTEVSIGSPLFVVIKVFSAEEVVQLMCANVVSENDIHTLLIQAIRQSNVVLLTNALCLADRNDINLSDFIINCFPCFGSHAIISPMFPIVESKRSAADSSSDSAGYHSLSILRLLLLHYSRPSPTGALSDYIPAKWLEQTFAKGWEKMAAMNAQTMSWGEICLDSTAGGVMQKVQRVSCLVFSFLAPTHGEHASESEIDTEVDFEVDTNLWCELPRLSLVCRSWRNNLIAIFHERISVWKVDVLTKKRIDSERVARDRAMAQRWNIAMAEQISSSRFNYNYDSDDNYGINDYNINDYDF